jgi:hypothetical protein
MSKFVATYQTHRGNGRPDRPRVLSVDEYNTERYDYNWSLANRVIAHGVTEEEAETILGNCVEADHLGYLQWNHSYIDFIKWKLTWSASQ